MPFLDDKNGSQCFNTNNNSHDIYNSFGDEIVAKQPFTKLKFTITPTENIVKGALCYWYYHQSGYVLKDSIQIEEGTTVTEYEPYGYKIPIKINNEKEYKVYITEPLRQYGDYIDYVDVVNKKVHRNVKVNEDGTLSGRDTELIEDVIDAPNITLNDGDNTIEVGTTTSPGRMEITYLSKKYE